VGQKLPVLTDALATELLDALDESTDPRSAAGIESMEPPHVT
jgi:hypothetical protein